MIAGETENREPKGPLAGIRKKWAGISPKKQKAIVISFFTVLILGFAAAGYHSRQTRHMNSKPVQVSKNTKDISLNTDLIEKSLFRQAQDTINQQGKIIADMRKEIAGVKAATERNAQEAFSQETRQPALPPPPDMAMGPAGNPIPEPMTMTNYGMVPPPISHDNKAPDAPIGGIAVVSSPDAPEVKSEDGDKKKFQIYLPPSFMEATLLSGLDAPTTTAGKSDPVPVLLRIKDLAILPNKVRGDLKGCFVLAEGKGNLASERVEVRLVTLSCVSKKGQSVIDQTVKGYIVDEDGKAGLRGIVSAKMGAMLARSALAGFIGGMGEAVQTSSMDFETTAMGTQTQVWSDTDTKNIVKGGIGGGISKSADQLEKFYLQLAEQTLPIIQVGATKTVTVVISEGINLEVKDATIIN
ncbi:MAG: TraB/VirB10 family protein [Desulfosalsimonadaceae bacterium]